MARVVLSLIVLLFSLVVIWACTPEDAAISEETAVTNSSEEIRYSAQMYYQLLLYIKENNLLSLDDCPRCRCFSDGTCIDICDSGVWP